VNWNSPIRKDHQAGFRFFCSSRRCFIVLSIGPVVAIAERANTTQGLELLKTVYAPVIWLHDHTILRKPLEAYVELWGVK
jgi:hypothetical protein